jgi:hypothetical protein
MQITVVGASGETGKEVRLSEVKIVLLFFSKKIVTLQIILILGGEASTGERSQVRAHIIHICAYIYIIQ